MKPLEELVRKNIWSLAPYSSARDEYAGKEAHVFLDANENPYNAPYNRYPDPLQREVKAMLERVKGVPAENIFLGNGSDEAIDLPYRIFCEPGRDNVVSIVPTYGMYKVCADINDVEYREVLLDEQFQFHADDVLKACDAHTKIIWLCSPNNPTGNSLNRDEMLKVIEGFEGIVIVDDPYGILSLGIRAFLSLAELSESSVLGYGIGAVRYELTHEDVLILIQPLSDNRENILSGYRDLSALCFHLYHLQKSKQHYLCAAIYSAV